MGLIILIILALSSCGTVGIVIPAGPPPESPPADTPGDTPGRGSEQGPRGLPGQGNNQTIRLDRGSYSGGTITGNRVTIVGRGRRSTFIRGDLVIRGNSCTVTDLTVQGSVLIAGNNADLRGARITGSVTSRGQNNVW